MKIVAGIDISKDNHHGCVLEVGKARAGTFPASKQGLAKLVKFVQKADLVVMEATGTYHEACAKAIYEAGIPVAVVNPCQARHFALARMARNKTDKVDAKILAEMAQSGSLRLWKPASQAVQELRGLLRVEGDLTKARTAKLAQLKTPEITEYEKLSYTRQFKAIQGEQKLVKKAIEDLLKTSELAPKAARLQQVRGVGPLVAATLLALMPEELEDGKQASAFAGLNPRQRTSGTLKNVTRLSKQGEPRLRHMLYIAAWHARNDRGPMAEFYQRMLSSKKNKQSALCALANKLARVCWALMNKDAEYDPARLTT